MLICIVCGKVIANLDPKVTRYGGCASCPTKQVGEAFKKIKNEYFDGNEDVGCPED